MGRKKSSWRPKDVFIQRGRYVYWPYTGCKNGRPTRGKQIVLGSESMKEHEVWAEYNKLLEQRQYDLKWLLSVYLESDKFASLGDTTRHNQKNIYFKAITEAANSSGAKFGDTPLDKVTGPKLMRYVETIPGIPTRNKHISFISAAWTWGMKHYDEVPTNIIPGLDLYHKEKSKEIYVTDKQYEKVRDMAPPVTAAAMELAYLCRARAIEICKLTYDDLLDEGIKLVRSKGSLPEITKWSERLQSVVALLQEECNHPAATHLLHKPKTGEPLKPRDLTERFKSMMRRFLKYNKITPEEKFTFHDLKAKGVSDHTDQYSGHKTLKGHMTYVRKMPKIESTR